MMKGLMAVLFSEGYTTKELLDISVLSMWLLTGLLLSFSSLSSVFLDLFLGLVLSHCSLRKLRAVISLSCTALR